MNDGNDHIILPEPEKPKPPQFILAVEFKNGGFNMHINTIDEGLASVALRRLSQAIDYYFMQLELKQKATGVQPASLTDVYRLKYG